MRIVRVIGALVAMFVAASLLTVISSSQASAAQARPPHDLSNVNAGEIRNSGKFFVGGKITTLRLKTVILQKKNCNKCAYKRFKSKKTNAEGGFRIQFDGPDGSCFRIVAGPTPRASTNRKRVGCIVSV